MLQKALFLITCMLLLCSTPLKSQVSTLNPFFFGQSEQKSNVTPFNLKTIGKYYADDKWNAGNIYLENGDSLIGYYMRYDLIRNHLEVIIDTKILAINGGYISRFEWFSTDRLRPELFINKDLTALQKQEDIPDFIEVLVDGKTKLYKCRLVFAPQQATSPSLLPDSGKKIQTIDQYYYEHEGKIFEVESGNRRNLKNLGSSQLNDYVDNRNLKFRLEADLIDIFSEFNSIKGNKKTE